MGRKATVQKAVKRAFAAAGDLAEDVVLNRRAAQGFDFGTMEPAPATSATVAAKAIITDTRKVSEGQAASVKTASLATADVGDITTYDKITFGGSTWVIGPVVSSDGFVTTVELSREV